MTGIPHEVQRIKRFHVVYTSATKWVYIGSVENLYKTVEVPFADDACSEQCQQALKFTSLLHILYSMEIDVDGEMVLVPVIQAALAVVYWVEGRRALMTRDPQVHQVC